MNRSADVAPLLRGRARAMGAVAFLMATCAPFAALGQDLGEATTAAEQVNANAAESQEDINAILDNAAEAAQRYAQAMVAADSLETYNEQLEEQVLAQEEELASLERQLNEIDTTNRELQPLMERMADALDQFVSLDVPFQLEERRESVDRVIALLGRADVTVSEKYRRILEVYQIELEYGRTLVAYEGVLDDGGEPRTVEFLQLGRVALMYQTLDGSETGYWDNTQRAWVVDNSYADEVEHGIAVALQEVAPDLLILPVPAPEEVGS